MNGPRRSPRPCSPDCKGWDIFNEGEGAPVIQRCDECWRGVPDAPPDAYYQIAPVCVLALDAATERVIEEGEG